MNAGSLLYIRCHIVAKTVNLQFACVIANQLIEMEEGKAALKKVSDFEEGLEKECKDWKSKLTGGLDNTQVLISLFILGFFYSMYTITNYTLGNTRDQYSVTSGCYCRKNARTPYRAWFGLCLTIWIIFHTYIFFERSLKSPKCCCDRGKVMEAMRHCIWKHISTCISTCLKNCFCKREDNIPNPGTPAPRDKLNLEHYERILWYRYYKLYVVGYSKDIKPDLPDEIKTKPNRPVSAPPVIDTDCVKAEDTDGHRCCYLECQNCCRCFYRYIFQWPAHFILVLLKYIAQGTTVPILMLQVFDTYALLCFFPDGKYCETASEYKIHLAQAAITISFYFCIALALLTNALLEWNGTNNTQAKKSPKLPANRQDRK